MKTLLSIVGLILATGNVQAAPLPLVSSQSQTSVAIVSEVGADAQAATAPPGSMPISSTSTLVGRTSFVSASALAAEGLLSSQAEADSDAGFSSAVAAAEYGGTFVAANRALGINLLVAFGDSADAQAFGASSLVLNILQNGMPFYSELISTSGSFSRLIELAYGATYSFDLVASSEADTTIGGNAFASALVTIGVNAVPEPSTLALALIAAASMVSWRRRSLQAEGRSTT